MRCALTSLLEIPGVFLREVSAVYLTEPVGFSSENWFYNLVVAVETALSPWELVARGLEIELGLGRVREGGLSDRVVDIDLLLYGESVLQGRWVQVPHPRLHERAFVLAPLCELAPDLRHPTLGRTMCELLRELSPGPEVRRLGRLSLPIAGFE